MNERHLTSFYQFMSVAEQIRRAGVRDSLAEPQSAWRRDIKSAHLENLPLIAPVDPDNENDDQILRSFLETLDRDEGKPLGWHEILRAERVNLLLPPEYTLLELDGMLAEARTRVRLEAGLGPNIDPKAAEAMLRLKKLEPKT